MTTKRQLVITGGGPAGVAAASAADTNSTVVSMPLVASFKMSIFIKKAAPQRFFEDTVGRDFGVSSVERLPN